MGDNYKYIMNMGLAFDEERAVKKMSSMAEKGWILKEMSLFRYKFVKSETKQLIYSMDFREADKADEEYYEFFKNSGWEHMCSYGPFHFFAAKPGTVPIYTDRESYKEKYKSPGRTYLKTLVISVLCLCAVWGIEYLLKDNTSGGVIHTFLLIAGMVSVGIAVPSLMVTVAFLFRTKKGYMTRNK